MKKLIILFLIATISTQAGPISWAKHHKRFLLMESAAVAASTVHLYGLRHCRRGNIEHCDEGYGSANANFWVVTGFSVVTFPSIAEGCWKENFDAKFCYIFAYGFTGYNAAVGVRDWAIYNPPRP